MNYVNDRFCELVQLPRNRQAILAMKKDVDDFLPSFCDSPAKLSRWGHHYFCDDDGGRLIFDLNSPHSHRCEICGKVYSNDVQDGVWVTFYRTGLWFWLWFRLRYTRPPVRQNTGTTLCR